MVHVHTYISPMFQGAGGRKRKATDSPASKKKEPPQKQRPIVHPRFKPGGSGANHTARMMVQPSTPMEIDLIKKQDENESKSSATTSASPGAGAPGTGGGQYNCSICGFSASRINVIILHNKTHTYGMRIYASHAGAKSNRSVIHSCVSVPAKRQVAPNRDQPRLPQSQRRREAEDPQLKPPNLLLGHRRQRRAGEGGARRQQVALWPLSPKRQLRRLLRPHLLGVVVGRRMRLRLRQQRRKSFPRRAARPREEGGGSRRRRRRRRRNPGKPLRRLRKRR